MANHFPGMNPYLEGYLWPDVHNALAGKIRKQLVPLLRPKYAARLAICVVEDHEIESELGIMYPDVEILQSRQDSRLEEPAVAYGTRRATPPTLSVPTAMPLVKMEIPSVHIFDTKGNRLVTSIEIISPVNKRGRGLRAYRQKRQQLHQSGVHLLEIDLLRRGTRVVESELPAATDYLVALTRSGSAETELWAVDMRETLPVVPVPLLPADDDVELDLQKALAEVCEEADYDLSINYQTEPPLPVFSQEKKNWLKTILRQPVK